MIKKQENVFNVKIYTDIIKYLKIQQCFKTSSNMKLNNLGVLDNCYGNI